MPCRCPCGATFPGPIPDPNELLSWLATAPWKRVFDFITGSGARGHEISVVDQAIAIYTKRRHLEEERQRGIRETLEYIQAQEAQAQKAIDRERQRDDRLERFRCLDDLLTMSPQEFEGFIADHFCHLGYLAATTSGPNDSGIDVEIRDAAGGPVVAIAQCKRYALHRTVGSGEIRDFAGAFYLTAAKRGYFFSTAPLTKAAVKTAGDYEWLKVCAHEDLAAILRSNQ